MKRGIRPWQGGRKQRQQQQQQEQHHQQRASGASRSARSTSKRIGRPRVVLAQAPPEAAILRQRLKLKFLKNQVSAEHLLLDGFAAWTAGIDVGNILQAAGEGGHMQNASRDLLRRFLEPNEHWPSIYVVKLPFLDIAEEVDIDIPIYLPHELMEVAMNLVDVEPLSAQANSWFRMVLSELDLPESEVVPLSLWGDGVPYTKTGSLFQVCPGGE